MQTRLVGAMERVEHLLGPTPVRAEGFLLRSPGRCWIAETSGEPVGSIFLVKDAEEAAKLRLLLVEPSARGQGLGAGLLPNASGFARTAGYRRITLWTQSILTAARRLYQAAGFRLVRTEQHESFGCRLTGEYWELAL